MKNTQISFADYTQPKLNTKNSEFMNPFDSTCMNVNNNWLSTDKSRKPKADSLELSSKKKQSRIEKAKQLLAKRLKQVTSLQPEEQENKTGKQPRNPQKEETKKWEAHMNPISKLTRQPFVRSKTCDEIRKEYSQKKQRRNNSSSKFSTPNTQAYQRNAQSTGINSNNMNQLHHTKISEPYDISSQKKDGSSHHDKFLNSSVLKNEPNVKQFSLETHNFQNGLVSAFDEEQLKKLNNEKHKRKIKNSSHTKIKNNDREHQTSQQSSEVPEISFPFKINSTFKHHEAFQPPGNVIRYNKDRQNNTQYPSQINNHEDNFQSKFTPKMERYGSIRKENKWRNSQTENKINPNDPSMTPQNLKKRFTEDDGSFVYSQEQSGNILQMSPSLSHNRSSVRSAHNPNELVTNLHLTNTILQEKLKLKEIQIQELSRNYCQVKNQLLYMKNVQNEQRNQTYDFSKPPQMRIKSSQNNMQGGHLNNEKYLRSFEFQNQHQYNRELSMHQFQNGQQEHLPSPKFCEQIEEQFRQGFNNPSQQPTQNRFAKIQKRKELFSSDLSEKISEQFDSEELYFLNKQGNESSKAIKKPVFKKSHFHEPDSKDSQSFNDKRDSLVYALRDQNLIISDQNYQNNQINENNADSLDIQSSNSKTHEESNTNVPRETMLYSEEMLLESGYARNNTQLINSQEQIFYLSPIKRNSAQKQDLSTYQKKLKNLPSWSGNYTITEESQRKIDYYLTPQKDEGQQQNLQSQNQNQGLFEMAVSTMKKRQSNDKNMRAGSSSPRKKQHIVDTIIQSNGQ